jgi:hypothetical protein
MFRIVYLPTGELVEEYNSSMEPGSNRSLGILERSSEIEILSLLNNGVVYPFGKRYVNSDETQWLFVNNNYTFSGRVPRYLLEVVEVPDVQNP